MDIKCQVFQSKLEIAHDIILRKKGRAHVISGLDGVD